MPTTTKPPNKRIFVAGRPPAAAAAVNISVPPPTPAPAPAPAPAASQCCCPACVGLECLDRTRYFSGQLLTEADLNNEQSYWLAKSRLHNRFLHGWGVVCGMQVVCSECDGWVTVKPGYAIDPCGNDIIVCSDYAFDVIKAIQACCTPSKQTSNCAPLRAAPPPNCQGTQQTWCITIEYLEQPSRMVAPLKQATPKSSACSCGGSQGGCGCGCGGSGNGSSAKCSCGSTTSQTSTAVPTGACEPTRINEGYKVCVVPAPQPSERATPPAPGTFAYQFVLCYAALDKLLLQIPTLPNNPNGDPQINQQAYQLVCNYLRSVQNAFATSFITHCQYETALNNISLNPPSAQTDPNYIGTLAVVLTRITAVLQAVAFDCYCSSLVPPCPPDPCDDRLILACVTVQDGKIINICHFGGRKQVVTFPVLYYWLSIFNFDKTLAALQTFIASFCCGDEGKRAGVFGANLYQKMNITSAGITSPAMVNQMMATVVAQNMGATMMNAIVPNAQTVDLRPLVGLDTGTVGRALESHKISTQNITTVDVSADPAWSDQAVAASPQFAPAAFSIGDNLTVYTKEKLVVGFDVTDPVAVLQKQVQLLQQQVNNMTSAGHVSSEDSSEGHPKKKH